MPTPSMVKRWPSMMLLVAAATIGPWALGATAAQPTAAATEGAPAKTGTPRVTILATGGTIAGQKQADNASALSYKSATLSAKDLISAVPGLDELATLDAEQIASVGSQDMNDKIWFDLARKIKSLSDDKAADGVVITHGTDTLEETAFFLSCVLDRSLPVVLTGAMRPASALSADGPANLFEAVKVAADPRSRDKGAMVVLNDTIHSPVWVTKSDTTNVATFTSPYTGPLGYVDAADLRYNQSAVSQQPFTLPLPAGDALPRVEIIYSHSNMDDKLINSAVSGGAAGIVLAGVGDGNTSAAALAALEKARADGVMVVRASRTYSGAVKRNVEVDDDKAGFVVAAGLNPPKARILAQLLIANKITAPDKAQQAFDAVTQTGKP